MKKKLTFISCFLLIFNQVIALGEDFPKFKRPEVAEYLKCSLFFDESSSYAQKYTNEYKDKRLEFEDPDHLLMDCESIWARHYFPEKPLSKEEADFPIAQIRVVYRDYTLLEMDIASTYAPQNQYCYAIDRNADDLFCSRIHALAKCFFNVQVTEVEYELNSRGNNMYYSTLECFKKFEGREWKYVQLLQNHDISLRPNRENVQILKWLNNSNDLFQGAIPDGRIEKYPGWTFSDVLLFENETRNTMTFNGHKLEIVISKGFFQSSLTREFVDFVMYDLNVMPLIGLFEERIYYAGDEMLFPTLNTMDAVAAPGGTTQHCKKDMEQITRYSQWNTGACHFRRNGICIFGAEYLSSIVDKLPHLYVNKMLPEYDFGAIVCWYEHLFNRTYIEEPRKLNETYYKSIVSVRIQSLKNKDGFVELESLKSIEECDFDPNL